MSNRIYNAWRRAEAYAVPMTKEGNAKAEERYKGFQQGYIAGLKAAELELEQKHSANKSIHKFFFQAKEFITNLRKEVE